MKYLVALFILFLSTLQTFGQQDYFVYLQTDNSQAFYVRINNNVYSSTASGYLILSKLPDNNAILTIGFAKSVFPEQLFNIPASHKDAGYIIKTFGDKGWGLLNLQTLAVIMNSNPPAEKKSPEITGSRKNDAFSLLLSNAVNDTAVLYAVSKPKKQVAPAVVVLAEEKKKDSTLREDLPLKDSAVLAKNLQPVKDSSLVAIQQVKAAKDTIAIAPKNLPVARDSVVVKKTLPAPAVVAEPKAATVKVKKTPQKKQVIGQKTDTLTVGSNGPAKPAVTAVVKNKKERKDTIILMNGRPGETNKALVKSKPVNETKLPATTKKDSVQLAKNDTKQKSLPVSNNSVPAINQHVPQKSDTFKGNAEVKKDTLATNGISKAAEEKKDSVISIPAKRRRPLVSKAAELFTDTSYVAVFVDESSDKYDTIRISIPFNEAIKAAKQDKAAVKETISPAAPATSPVTKTESIDRIAKDTTTTAVVQLTTAPVKADTALANKVARDSMATLLRQQMVAVTPKKDTPVISKPLKDSNTAVIPSPVPMAIKKDAPVAPPATDSIKTVQAPAQPLFLNSDCKEIAFDIDIDKLRIKMLLVTTDEDRIALAKKLYKQKCLLAKQVRALSELFKNDEGKYKWLDAVYPFVSDSGNFAALGDLLKDDYYLNRFKAMLRR
ncbi:MAG: DUF4476 domain-containing protein [Chitinophagaceae bacterium]